MINNTENNCSFIFIQELQEILNFYVKNDRKSVNSRGQNDLLLVFLM